MCVFIYSFMCCLWRSIEKQTLHTAVTRPRLQQLTLPCHRTTGTFISCPNHYAVGKLTVGTCVTYIIAYVTDSATADVYAELSSGWLGIYSSAIKFMPSSWLLIQICAASVQIEVVKYIWFDTLFLYFASIFFALLLFHACVAIKCEFCSEN